MGIIDNHFKQLNNISTEEMMWLCQDPLVKAVIEIKSKRIAAQQKRRMNSYGKWSKRMRDKYE